MSSSLLLPPRAFPRSSAGESALILPPPNRIEASVANPLPAALTLNSVVGSRIFNIDAGVGLAADLSTWAAGAGGQTFTLTGTGPPTLVTIDQAGFLKLKAIVFAGGTAAYYLGDDATNPRWGSNNLAMEYVVSMNTSHGGGRGHAGNLWGSANYWQTVMNPNGRQDHYQVDSVPTTFNSASAVPAGPTVGDYFHVFVYWNYATASVDGCRVYIGGVQSGAGKDCSTITLPIENGSAMHIGRRGAGTTSTVACGVVSHSMWEFAGDIGGDTEIASVAAARAALLAA